MPLKGKEKFVAETLKEYFAEKHKGVNYQEVLNDPPDIYLTIDGKTVSVEITELDENVLQGRRTADTGYIQFCNTLNKQYSHLLPKDVGIIISFYHGNKKVGKITKKFKNFFSTFLLKTNFVVGETFEHSVVGVFFKISIVRVKRSGTRKIQCIVTAFGSLNRKRSNNVGDVAKSLTEFNLSMKAYNIIQNRIFDKNNKCRQIKYVWLALYDNFYNKFTAFENDEHLDFYKEIIGDIIDFGQFEKVLIVFENKDVLEVK